MQTIWSLLWRLFFVLSYPTLITMRNANASGSGVIAPALSADTLDKIAAAHATSLIIGACVLCLLMGSVIGALYQTPDDIKTGEINPWLRFLVCLSGGFAAFLWVVYDNGALTLLTPLWVGGVAFVSPHLIQIVPTLVKTKLGLGDRS